MKKPAPAKPLFTEHDPLSWYPSDGGFALDLEPVHASLQPTVAEFALSAPVLWQMEVRINGHKYKGTRPTLEEAFKAADRLIYEKAKDVWLQSRCGAVIAPWVGNLEAL